MLDLIKVATSEVARFLSKKLPSVSPDWWQKHVVERLSFQQQRMVLERGHKDLTQLDFAALLRVFDQNWYELSNAFGLPREGRTWLKELQTVRNKWAHLSAEAMPYSEVYRDADTLGRLLLLIDASQTSLEAVEARKSAAVLAMANPKSIFPDAPAAEVVTLVASKSPVGMERLSKNILPHPTPLFRIGDIVSLKSDRAIIAPIIEIIPSGPECRYRVFQNNGKATYYESQLQLPEGAANERRTLAADELSAHLTSLHVFSLSTSSLFSLRSGRVQYVPYQYRPVLKLIQADRPRLLIADEVGVGKTIEAGLIIKELQARMNISSVLIICPKPLVAERKWFLEMKRFDEQFTALDGRLLQHCLKETNLEGEWPAQYAKAILPFSLFDSDLVLGGNQRDRNKEQGLLGLDPPPKFDLVIVDEAHHIRNADTFLHQGVRYFCDNAGAVLFLSATPVQLGSRDLYTLLNVLRPDLVIDHASFEQMAAPNRHINAAVQHCRAAHPDWQTEARASLGEAAQTEWGRMFLRESPVFQGVYDNLCGDSVTDVDRIRITRAIEELYTFSPLINRTRRRDIGEFTTRKSETLTLEFTAAQKALHDELLDVVARILAFCHGNQSVKFMMTTIRRQAASCIYGLKPLLQDILAAKLSRLELMEASDSEEDVDLSFVNRVRVDIEGLLVKARDLEICDPKADVFIRVLIDKSKLHNNKALVFSTFRHTLTYLSKNMQRTGLRYGLIHGDVPDEVRADLRQRFALPKEDSEALDVLLSSEVGCEGLDFQFCDFLVNYDLPWNPMRIEQRIGRIDRYGQKSETIAIVNFVTPGTVDADIYQRCLQRIGVFQNAIGGNEEILGEITKEIHDIAENFNLTPQERDQRLRQLADNGIRRIREEQELESRQAELFGLSIPNQSWQQKIEEAENCWLSSVAIRRCVTSYFRSRLENESEHLFGGGAIQTLRLGQEARSRLLEDFKRIPRSMDPVSREWEKWLKNGHPTLVVTFDQEAASNNLKAAHLSVMHPLVRQAAKHFQMEEPPKVSISIQRLDIPSGQYCFALYRWSKKGVRVDESLVPVASNPEIETSLVALLQEAVDSNDEHLPSLSDCDGLDSVHHTKWTKAQADHIAANCEMVEHRIQSLKVSHQARCRVLEGHIVSATNEKIILMRQSELVRANADFERHMKELQIAANSGDIHTAPVLFGTITVTHAKT